MKIYLARPRWHQPTGAVYCDTRAEARHLARKMAREAASNPELAPRVSFVVDVVRCSVSERFGRGRRFVVGLLNRERMIDPLEITNTVSERATTIRCGGCGCSVVAQDLVRIEPEGILACGTCYSAHGELASFESEMSDQAAFEKDHAWGRP